MGKFLTRFRCAARARKHARTTRACTHTHRHALRHKHARTRGGRAQVKGATMRQQTHWLAMCVHVVAAMHFSEMINDGTHGVLWVLGYSGVLTGYGGCSGTRRYRGKALVCLRVLVARRPGTGLTLGRARCWLPQLPVHVGCVRACARTCRSIATQPNRAHLSQVAGPAR
jgi:hypothetical protein